MTNESQPPNRRRTLLRAIAGSHLPLPITIDIFEVEQGYVSDHARLKLDDNLPADVEDWAERLGGDKPTFGATVKRAVGDKLFRSYSVDVVLAGWPCQVCSYVDLDVDCEPEVGDRWSRLIPHPHPHANCGPLQMALPPGVPCPTCGTLPEAVES